MKNFSPNQRREHLHLRNLKRICWNKYLKVLNQSSAELLPLNATKGVIAQVQVLSARSTAIIITIINKRKLKSMNQPVNSLSSEELPEF